MSNPAAALGRNWKERPPAPAELSDEQRTSLIAYFTEHKGVGYKHALRDALGVYATKAEAKALIASDPELVSASMASYGLAQDTLLSAVGEIVNDPEHRDRLAAIKYANNLYYGMVETKQIEHTGEVSSTHQVAVSVDHDFTAIADKLEEAGVIRRGPAALRPAPEPVLPAPADADASGGAGRSSLAS